MSRISGQYIEAPSRDLAVISPAEVDAVVATASKQAAAIFIDRAEQALFESTKAILFFLKRKRFYICI